MAGAREGSLKLVIRTRAWVRWLVHPVGRWVLAGALVLAVAGGVVVLRAYDEYARIVDARLRGQIFTRPAMLFSAPQVLQPGEAVTDTQVMDWLHRAGYSEDQPSPVGTYSESGNALTIRPGPESAWAGVPVQVWFSSGQIDSIAIASTGQQLARYRLEPELLTTLGNRRREKRRLLHFNQIPPMLVKAVIAIEDHDFFQEGAVDYWRIPAAAWRDLRAGYKEQGFSTITMQVARNFFLSPVKTYRRKLIEILIAEELEERLSKQQIFELYANQAYMGQQGTYLVRGFGEAARVYFHKDVGDLTLPECAMLAGILHGPGLDDPYLHPERVIRRRNQVLAAMRKWGYITHWQYREAKQEPLGVVAPGVGAGDAPYYTDLVREQIAGHVSARNLFTQGDRIYTTIDPDLQRAAGEAVQAELQRLEALLPRPRRHARPRPSRGQAEKHGKTETHGTKKKGGPPLKPPGPRLHIALIAMDPNTGAIRALVGGSDAERDPVNEVLLRHNAGSMADPFVDAAAFAAGLQGSAPEWTETSKISNQPVALGGDFQTTRFQSRGGGKVSLREALARALPNATLALAAKAGIASVEALLKQAGFVADPFAQAATADPVHAMAVSPLDLASAYSIFAHGGQQVSPRVVEAVRGANGGVLYRNRVVQHAVLDARVAFLVGDLLRPGYSGATARALGAAALPGAMAVRGSQHPGRWFAGYSSGLLCVVWVGQGDGKPLPRASGRPARRVWGEFMKQALALPAYRPALEFTPPPGVTAVVVNRRSGRPVTPACPARETEVDFFLDGTQPGPACGAAAKKAAATAPAAGKK